MTGSPGSADAHSTSSGALEMAAVQTILKALSAGSSVSLRVTGGSMWPTARAGDLVTVEPTSTSLAPGLLVLALRGGGNESAQELICHRLVHHDPSGGCLLSSDRWGGFEQIDAGSIAGVVCSVQRGISRRYTYTRHAPIFRVIDRLHASFARLRLEADHSPAPDPAKHLASKILRGLPAVITMAVSRIGSRSRQMAGS